MTGITRGRLPRLAAAATIVASGVLALPALAGATTPGGGVDKVDLGAGEVLNLKGKCLIDGKPGKAIGVISLLHKKATVHTSFSAWADADKDGSFAVGVKFSKTVTVEETHVAGVLCVSKENRDKHKVVKETLRCVRPKHPKPPVTTTTVKTKPTVKDETTTSTKAGSSTTSTTEKESESPETPSVTEVEKVIEAVAVPKAKVLPTAVKASPKFTG